MTSPRRRVAADHNPKTSEPAVGEETQLLLTMLGQLRTDFHEEREASRQSRARMHERLDGVADDVGAIKGDIRMLGEVDGQVKGEVASLRQTVNQHHAEVQPTVDAWRQLLKSGKTISWVFSIAGITTIGGLVGMVTGAWEAVGNALRSLGRF